MYRIDRLKTVNDSYGHSAGVRVLKTAAKKCPAQIRSTDFLARYGGEEFSLLLPNTNIEQALTVIENLRKAIGECRFHYAGEPVCITISCGVAGFAGHDTCMTVFHRADNAVYLARSAGRNNCKSERGLAARAA